jgi:DNA-binding LytR/AlgR family response regulator
MHIAVCDDNIADRKQTERLLGRQSDRFFKEDGERLYIDSYGNVEAFMRYPQMYDGLFIDMINEAPTGFEIVKMLLDAGVVRPIILCVSKIDYRKEYEESGQSIPNLFFIDKPIKVAELTAMMDKVREIKGDPVPTMELRGKDGTVYAKEDDIVSVKKKGSELHIKLQDGQTIILIDTIYNFYDQCAVFPQICPLSDGCLVNVNHVTKTSFGKATTDDGENHTISFAYRNAIKEARKILEDNAAGRT